MTDRRAQAWGAAIVAAGGLLAATAALSAGRPGMLWRPLAIGLTAYAASGALILRWGLEVYGPRGALGAVALAAFAPCALAAMAAPPLLAPAGGTTLLGGFAQLAACYALMRCLLDPTFQWVLVAGLAIATVPVGAFLHGSPAAAMVGLAVFSCIAVVGRTITAGRCEDRPRVARASVVSVGLAWALAVVIALAVAAASHLPSADEYVDARRGPSGKVSGSAGSWQVVGIAAAAAADASVPASSDAPAWAGLPWAALLLAAVRPWRRQRRYTDTGWMAALLCLGGPLWLAWGEPGGVFMAPIAALLAGACWDGSRPAGIRRAAALLVGLQIAAALLMWPRYPGGVRADAWLPNPDVSQPSSPEGP